MNLFRFSGDRIIEVRAFFNVADYDTQLGKGADPPADPTAFAVSNTLASPARAPIAVTAIPLHGYVSGWNYGRPAAFF